MKYDQELIDKLVKSRYAINKYEREILYVTNKDKNTLLYLFRKSLRESGLSMRNNTICKNKKRLSNMILIPIQIEIEMDYKVNIAITCLPFIITKINKNEYCCNLRGITSIEFGRKDLTDKGIKRIKKNLENSSSKFMFKYNSRQFEELLYHLVENYKKFVPWCRKYNATGWKNLNKTQFFTPIMQSILPENLSEKLYLRNDLPDVLMATSINQISGMKSLDEKKDYLKEIVLSFIDNLNMMGSDYYMFSSTIFSFIQYFYQTALIKNTNTILILYSEDSYSELFPYATFWAGITINAEFKQNSRNQIHFSCMQSTENIVYRDIKSYQSENTDYPLIVYNKDKNTRKKNLVSKTERIALQKLKRYPFLICPETFRNYPTTDNSFVCVNYNSYYGKNINNPYNASLGERKDTVLSIYQLFLYLFSNKISNGSVRISKFMNEAIKKLRKSISVHDEGILHNHALMLSALLILKNCFDEYDCALGEKLNSIVTKTIIEFQNNISSSANAPDEVKLKKVFVEFITESNESDKIVPIGLIGKQVFGWLESDRRTKKQYLFLDRSKYYKHFSHYLVPEERLTQKEFEKFILREHQLLVPQCKPSKKNVYLRYDVRKKVAPDVTVSTIKIDYSLLIKNK